MVTRRTVGYRQGIMKDAGEQRAEAVVEPRMPAPWKVAPRRGTLGRSRVISRRSAEALSAHTSRQTALRDLRVMALVLAYVILVVLLLG